MHDFAPPFSILFREQPQQRTGFVEKIEARLLPLVPDRE